MDKVLYYLKAQPEKKRRRKAAGRFLRLLCLKLPEKITPNRIPEPSANHARRYLSKNLLQFRSSKKKGKRGETAKKVKKHQQTGRG